MEKWNSQCNHDQPIGHTRGLFYMRYWGVACCRSHHQCHFWRMILMFEAYCMGAVSQIYVIHEAMNCCKNLNIH